MVRAKAVVSVAFVIAGMMFCCSAADPQSTSFAELMRLGDRESDNRRFNQAIDFYTKATKVSPNNWQGHAKRAALLVQVGRIKEARDSISRWVDMHPDAWAWYCHGMEMEDAGKYKAALSDLDRSCKLIHYSGKPFLRRAILRLLTGNFSGARQDAYTGLDYAPTWTSAYQLCAISDALCGSQSKAILHLNKYSFATLHKGSELQAAPQPVSISQDTCEMTSANAERLLKNVKAAPPSISAQQLVFAEASIRFFEQDYDLALKDLDAQKSGDVNFGLLRFYCFILKRELSAADKEIYRLVEAYPDSDQVLDALDFYYFERGTRQSGIKEIKQLLSRNAKNDAALYELSKICRDVGDTDEALRYCDMALQLRHQNEELLLIKANLLVTLGRDSEALNVLTDILSRNKRCGAAFMIQASIFSHQAKWEKAIESLSKAIELPYNLMKALPARSACYAANHQDALAKKDAEDVRKVDRTEWHTRMY